MSLSSSKLLEDLADIIFEAAKSSTNRRYNWSYHRDHYKIVVNHFMNNIYTEHKILRISLESDGYDFISTAYSGIEPSSVIIQKLRETASPEKFDEILKTLKKICLISRLERSKNE